MNNNNYSNIDLAFAYMFGITVAALGHIFGLALDVCVLVGSIITLVSLKAISGYYGR